MQLKSHRSNTSRLRKAKRGGFTLAETALAMTVLVVAMISISAATLRSNSLRRQNRERAVAMNAVRSLVDRIQAQSRTEQESDLANWSWRMVQNLDEGGLIGNTFDVAELNPLDPDSLDATQSRVGSIEVIVDENLTDAVIGMSMGMPRDLNGDDLIGSNDVSQGANLLPIIINVNWRGVSGETGLRHPFYILAN